MQTDLLRTVLALGLPSTETVLVNGLVVDARGFGQRVGCTDLCPGSLRPKMQGNLHMNVGYFEQISDCWSSEQQPPTYYRTAAARARRLQADATTPRVKQYLDKMVAHCEQF